MDNAVKITTGFALGLFLSSLYLGSSFLFNPLLEFVESRYYLVLNWGYDLCFPMGE